MQKNTKKVEKHKEDKNIGKIKIIVKKFTKQHFNKGIRKIGRGASSDSSANTH